MARRVGTSGLIALIDRLLLFIAGTALVAMMVHIAVDVAANELLGSPVPLTNAVVTQYYMICVAYLPLAAAELRGAHVSVDLVVDRMPHLLRRLVETLMQLLGAGIYLALAAQAWQVATEKLERDAFLMEQATRVTTWPSYFLIPAGFGLTAALILLRVVLRLSGRDDVLTPMKSDSENGHV